MIALSSNPRILFVFRLFNAKPLLGSLRSNCSGLWLRNTFNLPFSSSITACIASWTLISVAHLFQAFLPWLTRHLLRSILAARTRRETLLAITLRRRRWKNADPRLMIGPKVRRGSRSRDKNVL